jgi:hypothetical protein
VRAKRVSVCVFHTRFISFLARYIYSIELALEWSFGFAPQSVLSFPAHVAAPYFDTCIKPIALIHGQILSDVQIEERITALSNNLELLRGVSMHEGLPRREERIYIPEQGELYLQVL